MKTKKLTLFALGLVVLLAIAGCTPNNTGYNNRLGTQTRIGNNGFGTNNWRDGTMSGNDGFPNNGMNNGLNTGLNNGLNDGFNNRLNTNTNLTNNMGTGNASELARRIGALPEVTSAAVAVSGNRAIVGVNLNGANNGANNGINGGLNTTNLNTNVNNNFVNQNTISASLRQKIETIVKDSNRNITSVAITSDPSLFTRIQNMSNGTNGGVMNTIGNDFEDLIRRITPNTTNTNR